jgi:hypothetical protein
MWNPLVRGALIDENIGYLPRLHASAAEKLEETGVESISDPDNFPLSERQRRACTAAQRAGPGSSAKPGNRINLRKEHEFPESHPQTPRAPSG